MSGFPGVNSLLYQIKIGKPSHRNTKVDAPVNGDLLIEMIV